ncbi:hypothetical protein NEFER03_1043 [Nematocida sp. LUAm3]|nr:hypothetical protein NEFER03_1043 [Nematocida sp. LUAm3]KAI5175353.1 hypothetical protein NEFER02_1282 [Nematocida sp. LUAm2]KAI5177690.1 hypothetical protein NEFER01_0914 [Nematocida sp. LUAm1]
MEEWEFLRRPVKAKSQEEEPQKKKHKQDEEDPPRIIEVLTSIGGANRVFQLEETNTFESIYEEYESRFLKRVLLQKKGANISKYTKIKSMCEDKETSIAVQVVLQEEDSPRKQRKIEMYRIRYTPTEFIDIFRDKEVCVEDLLNTSIKAIEEKEKRKLSPSLFIFNGDILPMNEKIDSILLNEDLIDLIPHSMLHDMQ